MKKLLSTAIIATILLFSLSGCSKQEPIPPKTETIKPENDIYTIKMSVEDIPEEIHKLLKENKQYFFQQSRIHLFKESLKKAITITEENNKTEFALLLPNANHFEGFPLNRYEDLKKFCIYLYRCGYNYDRDGHFRMNIKPMESVSHELALINIEQLKEDLKGK